MNKITLSAITISVSATAVVGLLTKNKVDALQHDLRTTKVDLSSTRKTLDTTKETLAKTNDDLAASNKSLADAKSQIESISSERDKLTQKVTEQEAAITAKTTELADISDKLKKIQDGQPGLDGASVDSLLAKVKDMTTERDQLANQLNDLKQEQETLIVKTKTTEQALASANERVKHYELNIAKAGVTGRVLAVNPGWNFVVLNVGDRSGVAVNAGVVVSRNGQNIARARIKAVEPGMSIADIIPESMSHGETVQPGDRIVFSRM